MKPHGRCLPKHVYQRGHSFYIDIRINGERIRRAAGDTLEEAELELARLQAGRNPGNGQSQPDAPAPLFDALVKRYLARSKLFSKASSYQSADSSCRRLLKHFGGLETTSLAPADLERFISARLRSVSREAVNRDLRYLKALFRLAVEEGLLEKPPFKVALLRTTRKLPTILTQAELATLFEKAEHRLRPLLMTAAMAGLRHGELAALDWADVDLSRRTIAVRAKPEIGFSPKSHAEREVPINTRLARALETHRKHLTRAGPNDPVFQRNLKRASRWEPSALCAAVRDVFKEAGLYRPKDRPGLHMLRRSFASHALARRADIQTVRELGGWSGLAVVERYVASTERLKREAVERLDF